MLVKCKGLSKKEIERLFGKQAPSPYYKAGYNAYIRMVRVLKNDFKRQAKIMGLKGNDLVLIASRIEKVEGSPTDFLVKRCKKLGEEMKYCTLCGSIDTLNEWLLRNDIFICETCIERITRRQYLQPMKREG